MRKLLNILYVTTDGAYLAKDGENVVISVDGEIKMQLPIHTLEGLVCFGYCGASPALMHFCAESGVGLSFHDPYGKFLARIQGPVQGNVLLRRRQYQAAMEPGTAMDISRNIISAKVVNARGVLLRAVRERPGDEIAEEMKTVADKLKGALGDIQSAHESERLRGIEGDCARLYFSVFGHMVLQQQNDFIFSGRTKRPPTDRLNALLSFLYTMLAHDVQSALESVGLDPYMGFLHQPRPGRPSLALDLMEEFRAVLADRVALSLVNKRQLNAKSFVVKENGAVLLDKDHKKTVLETWFNRKKDIVQHPFLGEKMEVGLLPYAQALLLARYLRGDLEAYPPYIQK